MNDLKSSQEKIINDVIFIGKAIYTIVSMILLYSLDKYNLLNFPTQFESKAYLIFIIQSFIPLLIMLSSLLILAFTYEKRKSSYNAKRLRVFEMIVYLSFFIFILKESEWSNSNSKFMPVFLVIIYSIEFGPRFGNLLALLCSAIVLMPVLLSGNIESFRSIFQQDLVLCAAFFLIVYILKVYIQLQDEYTNKLIDLSNKDGLTGVYNRGYFNNHYLKLCSSENTLFSLIILDIDHFKSYNDNNGHVQGDVLLKSISNLFEELVGENGIVARYGGEEFVVLMENRNYEEALFLAESIRHSVEDTYFDFQDRQPNGNLTISVGVSSYPDAVADCKSVLESADQSLYYSKENGRNKVTGYKYLCTKNV